MNIIEEARNGREEAGQGEGAHGAGEEARAPISPGRKANLLADLTLTSHQQANEVKTTGSVKMYQISIQVNIAKNNIYINVRNKEINVNNKNIHRILIMRHNKIK